MTRSLASAALAAALLVLPAAGAAQEGGPLPRKPAPSSAPPAARAPAPAADEGGALQLGGLLGFEFASGDTGLALRLDGEMKIQDLAPGIGLSGVASLGYTYFEDDASGGVSNTVNLVKLVPAARFSFPRIAPQLGLYADGGVGLYYASQRYHNPLTGNRTDSAVGVTMRFAGGALFDLSERLRLGAELGVNPYFGDFDYTTLTVLAALTYRL